MGYSILFFLNSGLLGVGLAMDAFSVSLVNGLNEPKMSRKRMCGIACVFGMFQGVMPMAGWICIHSIVRYFKAFEKAIPWIALALLVYIGTKMLIEGIKHKGQDIEKAGVGIAALMVQGIATSIDALSVGFTIASYEWVMALTAALIIAAITFIICMIGLKIGKLAGIRLSKTASVIGGIILIGIGLEIFISSWF